MRSLEPPPLDRGRQAEGDLTTSTTTGQAAGAAAVARISTDEPFWNQLGKLAKAHQAHGIETFLVAEQKKGDLGAIIASATSTQLGLLYNALQVLGVTAHPGPCGEALTTIFQSITMAAPGMKRACFAARWGIRVIKQDAEDTIDWDAPSLMRLWRVLTTLPPSHVEHNPNVTYILREKLPKGTAGTGGSFDETNTIDLAFDPQKINTQLVTPVVMVEGLPMHVAKPGDPIVGVNSFDWAVRHEVGHAIDSKLGISESYCKTAAGGGWEELAADDWVRRLFTMAHIPSAVTEVAASIAWKICPDDEKPGHVSHVSHSFNLLEDELAKRHQRLPAEWIAPTKKVLGEIIQACSQLRVTSDTPALTIGSRAYFMSGKGYTYDVGARARQVSNYQFSAPGEWVAEAYAAYYEPDARGRGARLADKDPNTKNWFDKHVHGK